MNTIQEYKKTTVFAFYDRFMPSVKGNMVVWKFAGKDLIRYSLFEHIYRFVPKIRTGYGLAPALSIVPEGDGTFHLFDNAGKTILSNKHTLSDAENILFEYYAQEYNKSTTDTTYFLKLRDAVNHVIDDIIQQKKISRNEAGNHLASYTNQPELVKRALEQIKVKPLPDRLEKYLDVIYCIPGERFQSTLIRIQEALPQLPDYDQVLLTKHIRINSFQTD